MYEYLCMEVGDAVDRATLRDFCDRSVEMIEWLEAHGVEFDATVPPCKTSYPADGYYLYFSGNETVKEYAGKHPPAPRGHRVKGAGLSGAMLFRALRQSVNAAGARVMPQSSVRRLVVDNKSGAVLGAELWQFEAGSRAAKRHRRLSRWAEQMQYPAPGVADMLRRRALAVELADARPLLVRARGRSDAEHGRLHLQSRNGRAARAEIFAQLPPRHLRMRRQRHPPGRVGRRRSGAPRARISMAVHQSSAGVGARHDRRHATARASATRKFTARGSASRCASITAAKPCS